MSKTTPETGIPFEEGKAGEEVHKVTSLIDTARRLLGEGKSVDLAALEEKVETLCRAIRQAPTGEAKKLSEPLATLIDKLDGLAADLTRQHQSLRAGAGGAISQQAVGAYRKAKDTV